MAILKVNIPNKDKQQFETIIQNEPYLNKDIVIGAAVSTFIRQYSSGCVAEAQKSKGLQKPVK